MVIQFFLTGRIQLDTLPRSSLPNTPPNLPALTLNGSRSNFGAAVLPRCQTRGRHECCQEAGAAFLDARWSSAMVQLERVAQTSQEYWPSRGQGLGPAPGGSFEGTAIGPSDTWLESSGSLARGYQVRSSK